MHQGGFGPVMDPEDVTKEMLPEKGSKWLDTIALKYKLIERIVRVEEVTWNPWQSTEEQAVWDVKCQEDRPWGRVFTMQAHGFLSRYEKMD